MIIRLKLSHRNLVSCSKLLFVFGFNRSILILFLKMPAGIILDLYFLPGITHIGFSKNEEHDFYETVKYD